MELLQVLSYKMRKARHWAKFNGQNNWGLTYKEEMNYILITYLFHLEGTKKKFAL